MRSYYITPRRLVSNTFLWKTIKMMAIINKERVFEVPAATREWLRVGTPTANWTTITPENAVLCMEYAERHLEYPWENNPVASEKIMNVLINSEKHRTIALRSKHFKEEAKVTFIEGTLTEEVVREASEEKKLASAAWRRLSQSRVHEWTQAVLRSSEVKTYQIEYLYNLYRANYAKPESITYMLASNCKASLIPDYIFEQMLPLFYQSSNDLYTNGETNASILREAVRRGMLVPTLPFVVNVASQPKPSFAPVPETSVVPAPEEPIRYTSTYLLPKKVGP